MAMNPSNDTFASGSMDGTIRFWDLKSNQCQGLLRWGEKGRPCVAYDPSGVIFGGGFSKNQIKLFDVRAYEKGPFTTFTLKRQETEWSGMKFSPDGKYLLAAALDGGMLLVDSFDGHVVKTFAGHLNANKTVMEASFSPDSKYVLAGSEDGSVYCWSCSDNSAPVILSGHGASVSCVQWNPKKMMMASACSTLAMWVPQI